MVNKSIGWIDVVTRVAAEIAAVIIAIVALHIFIDALARTVLRSPLQGTLELTQYAWMPAAVSLSLAYAMYRGEHIRVDLLTSETGPRVRRVIEVVAMLVTLVVVVLAAWAGFEAAVGSVSTNESSEGYHWIILWPGRIAVAVGLIALALQTFAQLVRAFANEIPTQTEEFQMWAEDMEGPEAGENLQTADEGTAR